MYKNNKRKYTGKSHTYSKKKGYKGNLKNSQKGFYRTGGNYGRYKSGEELKYQDSIYNDATVSATGTVNANEITIVQGTNETQRIGRKIVLKKIIINWNVGMVNRTDITSGGDYVRVIVIQDKQCNGAAFTVGDFLKTTSYLSQRNLENSARFKVLKEFKVQVRLNAVLYDNFSSAEVTGEVNEYGMCYIDCHIPIEYSGTTGAITERRSNNIGILTISDKAQTSFLAHIRVRYTDN